MTAEPPATSFRLVATTRRCRAHQHDRVLAGVKARRFAPPPLRGADGLDAGCAHGPRRSCPTARERSDRRASGTLEERRTVPMEETDRRRCYAPTSRSTSPKSPIHIPGIGDPLHRNTQHWRGLGQPPGAGGVKCPRPDPRSGARPARRPRPGGGRAGSGPPRGPRPRTCDELGGGGRRDSRRRRRNRNAGAVRRGRRRRPSGGPAGDPSATPSAAMPSSTDSRQAGRRGAPPSAPAAARSAPPPSASQPSRVVDDEQQLLRRPAVAVPGRLEAAAATPTCAC